MRKYGKTKWMALCLVLLLAIGMCSITAFAISETDKGVITVEDVEDGVIVSAYRLMNVNYDYVSDAPQEPLYTWVAGVQEWVTAKYPQYKDANKFNTTTVTTAEEISTFYDNLAAAVKGGTIPLAPVKTRTGSGDIEGLDMGNYLVLIENGMKIYRPSAVNLTPTYNLTTEKWEISVAIVEVKSSEPNVDKTINEKVVDKHNKDVSDNANIGDKIQFDVRADIPKYPENAIAKGYAFSDIFSAGLNIDTPSIKVYGVPESPDEPEVLLEEPIAYKISGTRPNSLGDSSFTATFGYEQIEMYSKVHIVYNATLTAEAVIGTGGNPNRAILDYNNNPYDASSWKTKEDKVTVYTYGIDIEKTDKTTSHNKLAGAEFTLSKKNDGTELIKFIGKADGSYRKAAGTTEAGADTKLVVGSEDPALGKLLLTGLDAGKYYLTETKAPSGYNKLSSPVEINIVDEEYDGSVTVSNENLATGLVPITVQNSQGFVLPTTGGTGELLYSAIGVILMGGGIFIIFELCRRRRLRKRN